MSRTEILRRIAKQDIRNTMAMTWMVLSFVFLFKLLSKPIPPENKDVVNTIAGVVIGQLIVIIGYYFTQSKSEVDHNRSEKQPPTLER